MRAQNKTRTKSENPKSGKGDDIESIVLNALHLYDRAKAEAILRAMRANPGGVYTPEPLGQPAPTTASLTPLVSAVQVLATGKAQSDQDDRAATRQAWMEKRHPGESLLWWHHHTHLAYETVRKYWNGVTTRQTRTAARAALAKAENVRINTVPK